MRKSDKKMIWSMFSFIVNLLWDIRDRIVIIPPSPEYRSASKLLFPKRL